MVPRRRSSLAACIVGLILCSIVFAIHSQLQYLTISFRARFQTPSETSARRNLRPRSSSVVSRGSQGGTASQDPLQQGKAAFDDLPEFARGTIVGLAAAFVYTAVPSLGALFIVLMGIYIFVLDPVQKAEIDENFQHIFGSFANRGAASHMYTDAPVSYESAHAGYMTGEKIEVLRSDQTWSPAEVREILSDGSLVVSLHLDGKTHTKTVYSTGVAKFVRRPMGAGFSCPMHPTASGSAEEEPVDAARSSQYGSQYGQQQQYGSQYGQQQPYGSQYGQEQQQYGSQYGEQQQQYGSQYSSQYSSQYGAAPVEALPTSLAATLVNEESDCTYAHAGMAPPRHSVGDRVEVMRSDKSWHSAIVSELRNDGSIMVTLGGGAGVKVISEARVGSVIRSLGGFAIQFQPGRLMMEIQHETGMVVNVGEGGQASQRGVQAGWVISRVNGKPFSLEAFYGCASSGSQPYTLTFDNV